MKFEAGRYDNITLEQYHRELGGWSKSSLDLVNRSMAHYLARDERESTPAMIFGAALHCAVLTPVIFEADYVVAPNVDRRTKAGREEWAAIEAGYADKTIISAADMATIVAMDKAVKAHPIAAALLNSGDAEHSFLWLDRATGLACKCRPDYLRRDGIITDIKTCESAAFDDFQRAAYSYRYHVQGAFFLDGVNAVLGTDYKDFAIVAVEKKPPYSVAVYRLWDDMITNGRLAYQRNLRVIVDYEKTPEAERWAGYPVNIQDLYLPAWAS